MEDDNSPIRLKRSTMKVQYPKNWVYISRSGHELHFDDTDGKERIRVAHKDGAYWELSPGGHSVQYIPGRSQNYHKSGVTMTVEENYDMKGHAHMRMVFSGGQHVEIKGDASVVTSGNMNAIVGGNQASAVKGKLVALVDGDSLTHVKGNSKTTTMGDTVMKTAGKFDVQSGGTFSVKAPKIALN